MTTSSIFRKNGSVWNLVSTSVCRQVLMTFTATSIQQRSIQKRDSKDEYFVSYRAIVPSRDELYKEFCQKHGYTYKIESEKKYYLDPKLILKPYALHYALGLLSYNQEIIGER